jgi:peptidoglycan hydrolase-like protein with peptidoglycan-binding domain
MGRNGPAFLAYPNFSVYLDWNQSLVYATTAAYFATRLGGAPPVGKGNGKVAPFGAKQVFELQRLLVQQGYDVGKIDGILGTATRDAVKDVQIKLGLPADSYPTPELLDRLQTM